MTIEKLREVHARRPFHPFTLYLADGGKVRITHPESVAYSASGRTIVVVFPDDSSQWIDLLLVSRIEMQNGARRRGTR